MLGQPAFWAGRQAAMPLGAAHNPENHWADVDGQMQL